MLVTWGTNISINYGNEYFDYDMDRPGQVAAIKREVEKRRALKGKGGGEALNGKVKSNGSSPGEGDSTHSRPAAASPSTAEAKKELNEKIMGNTTRIIHDGTFPPWTALLLAAIVQLALIGLILFSRSLDPILNPARVIAGLYTRQSPFRGFALTIGIVSSFLSQEYVGPPLRLHYHGFGELISALFLAPISVLWGLTAYYTATNPYGRSVSAGDMFYSPTIGKFGLDTTIWTFFAAAYLSEQARILIMHIHDIEADTIGGKITFVVRIGYERAARLYVALNVLAVIAWGTLARRLVNGKGVMLSGAGSSSGLMAGLRSASGTRSAAAAVGRYWAMGVAVVLAFSIPIMVLTATSLFANMPNRPKNKATPKRGLVPIVPHMELVKLVSLQCLLTPVVLSIAAVLAGSARG